MSEDGYILGKKGSEDMRKGMVLGLENESDGKNQSVSGELMVDFECGGEGEGEEGEEEEEEESEREEWWESGEYGERG